MKRALKPVLIVLCVAAAYIIGAVLFVSVTTLPHISLALNDQKNAVFTLSEKYASGELSPDDVPANRKLIVYSKDAEVIAVYDPHSSIPYSCEEETNKYFVNGKHEALVKPMVIVESNIGNFADRVDIIIYAVQPVIKNGEHSETLVYIADLISDIFFVQNSFVGFNFIFFSFLACGIFIILKQRSLMRQKQNYIDNITHELKTPISSIKALTSSLIDHNMDADTRSEYYGLILAEASRQEHMVQNILELSRIQSHDLSMKKSLVDCAELFAAVCKRYSSLCDDLDIQWKADQDFSKFASLYTNADCVQRILDILLGNALRYTEEGGLIELSVTEEGRHITVCVSDNGNGIPLKELEHIFERFYRGSNSYIKGGNGLGLAIAKEICTGLGEKIWAESKGHGSKFYFTISKK